MSTNKVKLINYTKNIARASAISIGVTIFALLVQTLIMFYTDVSESVLPITSAITMTLSVTIASVYASLKIKKKGWINGSIIGIIYISIIIAISLLFLDDFVLNAYVLLKTGIALVTGAISGMIGVNLK